MDQQLNFDPQMYDQTSLCAKRAWEHIPENNATQGAFASIKQGPQEPFVEFTDRLQQAIRRQVNHNQVADILLLQQAFENAKKACQFAMKGVRAKATAVGDLIKACQYVGTETHKARVFTVALRPPKFQQEKRKENSKAYFQYGKPGHFKKDCPSNASSSKGELF